MRDAACLAHAIPGVAVRLQSESLEILVSAGCLGATLDPCRFRCLVIAGSMVQGGFLDSFGHVEIAGGLVHLGGGLYQPSHPGSTDDRWFVSMLDHDNIGSVLSACPLDGSDAHAVLIKPDPELGRCAVRIRCQDRSASRFLDAIAMWAMSACLIEELTAAPSIAPSRRRQ